MLSEILACMDRPDVSSRDVKLTTRAGMGICQGRTCRSMIAAIVAAHDAAADVRLARHAPVRPLLLADLADSEI